MNVREAVVQRRWSNSHDVRFPCIHLEEIKTVILCNNITVDTKRFHECLNHFNSSILTTTPRFSSSLCTDFIGTENLTDS